MENILAQLNSFINSYGILSVCVFGIIGAALTYFGLRVYRLLCFLVGLVCGAILGYSGAAAAGLTEIGCAVSALVAGVLCGGLALFFVALAVFLLGAVVGAMLAAAFISTEPMVLIIAGAISGAIFISLHQLAIIIGTSWCGAGMLTYAGLNGFSLLVHGHQAWLPGDFLSYMGRVGNAAYRERGLQGGFDRLEGDLLVFAFFFITGIAVQLNFHRLFLKKKRPTTDETTVETKAGNRAVYLPVD